MGAKNWNRGSPLSIRWCNGDYEALKWMIQIMLTWKRLPLHVPTMVIEENTQHNMPTVHAEREGTVITRVCMPLLIVNSITSASITILFFFIICALT